MNLVASVHRISRKASKLQKLQISAERRGRPRLLHQYLKRAVNRQPGLRPSNSQSKPHILRHHFFYSEWYLVSILSIKTSSPQAYLIAILRNFKFSWISNEFLFFKKKLKKYTQKCHFMKNPYHHPMAIWFTTRAHTGTKLNFKLKDWGLT